VHTGFCWGDVRKGDHLKDLGVDGRIILNWIFKNWGGEAWTGLVWLRLGTRVGGCECGNELSGCIKCGEFLE
jgi:hypothetical protein